MGVRLFQEEGKKTKYPPINELTKQLGSNYYFQLGCELKYKKTGSTSNNIGV